MQMPQPETKSKFTGFFDRCLALYDQEQKSDVVDNLAYFDLVTEMGPEYTKEGTSEYYFRAILESIPSSEDVPPTLTENEKTLYKMTMKLIMLSTDVTVEFKLATLILFCGGTCPMPDLLSEMKGPWTSDHLALACLSGCVEYVRFFSTKPECFPREKQGFTLLRHLCLIMEDDSVVTGLLKKMERFAELQAEQAKLLEEMGV